MNLDQTENLAFHMNFIFVIEKTPRNVAVFLSNVNLPIVIVRFTGDCVSLYLISCCTETSFTRTDNWQKHRLQSSTELLSHKTV